MANVYANRIEQNTPYGSMTYDTTGYMKIDPKTGHVEQLDDLESMPQVKTAEEFSRDREGFRNYNEYLANSAKYIPIQQQNVELSPEQQQLLDIQQKQDIDSATINNDALSRVGEQMGQGFNPEGLADFTTNIDGRQMQGLSLYGNPALQEGFNKSDLSFDGNTPLTGRGDYSADRTKVEDAIYSRMDRKFDQDEEAMHSRLANQGIVQGSEAWNREIDRFNEAKNDGRMQAIMAGGQEQSRLVGLDQSARQMENQEDIARTQMNNQSAQQLAQFKNNARMQAMQEDVTSTQVNNQNQSTLFNQDMQRGQFGNQTRGQQLSEALTRRQLPMNEYASLRSGQQITNPSFNDFYKTNIQGGDVQGAIQQHYQDTVSMKNANAAAKANETNQWIQGGMQAAQLGMMAFSDRRLKRNIHKFGTMRNGLNVYRFNYLWSDQTQIGVMADEVEKVKPELVYDIGGFKAVNYAGVGC